MTKADLIRAELPGLRRYARALTGSQASGDALVRAAIEGIAKTGASVSTRLDLYQHLEGQFEQSDSGPLTADAPVRSKRADLLINTAGFTRADASRILGMPSATEADVDAEAAGAETSDFTARNVLIIEDEPLVASHIAEIVRSMGHSVCAIAASAAAARAACAEDAPDLILSDMVLGDNSAGGEVAKDLAARFTIPVIYITAHPHSLPKGTDDEPAYLITKPFRTSAVKNMVEQVLIEQKYQRAG